jgi:hypothetical protein
MKAPTTFDRPSLGVFLVALLVLMLDLVVLGLLSIGSTPMLIGLGLTVAWLLLVILSGSKQIRVETVAFLKKFLDAAREFNG